MAIPLTITMVALSTPFVIGLIKEKKDGKDNSN